MAGTTNFLPGIRLTGVLVEDGRLLIVRQRHRRHENWNLPGGRLEPGETVGEGLRREMREEAGLDVEVGELLYVTDRFRGQGRQDVDLAFEVSRRSTAAAAPGAHALPARDTDEIAEVALVPIATLPELGFSQKFARLVRAGFPGRGTYQGNFHEFYGRCAPGAPGAPARGVRVPDGAGFRLGYEVAQREC